MWKDRIALQLYSVRDDLKADFYGTLKKVKQMGYTGVEFAGLCGNPPADVRKMCEELGLVPLSAHVPYLDLLSDTDALMHDYAALGCQYVVVPYLLPEYRPGNDAFYGVVDALPGFAKAAAKYGLTLQYHNHDFEFRKLNGEYALDMMFRTVGAEQLQTQLDTCWIKFAGEDPVQYLKKYADRVPTVHLKDFSGTDAETNKPVFCPVGKGCQDFPSIIKAALDGGTRWFIVEQDAPSMGFSPMECAAISAQYLKGLNV